MKRIFAFLMSLLLALSLCACTITEVNTTTTEPTMVTDPVDTEPTTPSTDATEGTETTVPNIDPTVDPYDIHELEELLGISIGIGHTATTLEVEITWTNKEGFDREFGYRYNLYAYQNNTKLELTSVSDNVNTPVKPNETITIQLQFALNDTSVVTLELRDDPNTPSLLWTDTYDLSAVG